MALGRILALLISKRLAPMIVTSWCDLTLNSKHCVGICISLKSEHLSLLGKHTHLRGIIIC